nr:hypothetical protein [Tanacetum cinerariifolium]
VKNASTPMETQRPLLKVEEGKEVDVHMYRLMIGSLMYLTSSRPDIMFAVCACAKYQVNLNVSHRHGVKRIFSARNKRWLQIPQQKLNMWLLQVAVDNQFKYVAKILRKFGLTNRKSASTPIDTEKPLLKDPDGEDVDVHTYRYLKGKPHLGLWYPKDLPFNLVAYSNSDYSGASLDRKSTIGGCQFLSYGLISWQCKKQTVVATSSTEDEYVAAASCCTQVLWIQNQLLDYGYNFMHTTLYIDNSSTICIIKNPVLQSKIKHIEIKHHFIRDYNDKKLFQVVKIPLDNNFADLLTKAFDVGRFQYLVACIRLLNP